MRSRERAGRGHKVENAGDNMRMLAKVTGWAGRNYVPQSARHGSYAYLAFWGHVYCGFDSAFYKHHTMYITLHPEPHLDFTL